jgi:undecaprenyl-diphosphatase
LVGVAQSIAITPGISRSGSTMATGLFCRFDQVFAARFSFLMAIPAILGSVVLEAKELKNLQGSLIPVLMGVVAAAITGFLSIKWLLGVIGRGRLYLFSYYCWIVGLATVFFI